ncbi:MAG TPA: exo-beta-N-acetylmuramidase NamZ domain-containing protein, partial [Blastocatellia bacterium]|nr:exo-beta-N-acetylmuramidase NamZ domain-containing protein [Blastocatellia bacterium]
MRNAILKIESAAAPVTLIALIALIALLATAHARAFSGPEPRRQKAGPARVAPQSLPVIAPERVGMSGARLARIDEAVRDFIERKQTPGAVVLVGRNGRVVYRKGFGDRAVAPQREPMTVDTIFDLASLTKVVATATSIMILVERGKLSLADPVALFIPEFARFGKDRVTVEQLLTHRSGLAPDNDISDYVGSSVDPLEEIYDLQLTYEPGSRFVYSDVGYIVAAEIVRRVSGQRLDRFAGENIFAPLGMRDTAWGRGERERGDGRPLTIWSSERLARTAPTEMREGRWMRGEVHDPRAYELGGVAGHAGLFSTADDLAIFCQMFLNRGEYAGVRLLAPYTIERMLSAHSLPASQMRGIGWDVNTPFSSNRGDLFPVGTFGHTGFTGTSIWIDPISRAFVVLLTNRVHPNGRGDVSRLRSLIASIVAGSITDASTAPLLDFVSAPMQPEPPRAALGRAVPSGPLHPVLAGIDVLERDSLRQLEGRKVALITNHTGRTREGRSTIDVLASAPNLKLVSIITPEHGLRGAEDAPIQEAGRDEKTGLPVYSVYARNRRRPTREMLNGADTVVFDVQDVGVRFYTYITTCAYAMEEAAREKIKFVVLDRPNPIDGYTVEGPVADPEFTTDPGFSFTTAYALPVRHGLTVGEFAGLYNAERKIGADLTVIKMEGWRRADYYDATGLAWVNPSPNMRSLTQAVLYPGIGLLEMTNVSVGRGTDSPFEVVGAPWINEMKLGEALNRAGLAGVRFVPVRFTPRQSRFTGEECGGVNIIVTDRNSFRPVATGLEIAYQ